MSIPRMLFGVRGRITRLQFWLYRLGSGAFIGVVMWVLTIIFQNFVQNNPAEFVQSGLAERVFGAVFVLLYILLVWTGVCISAKRCHDRDKSAWFILVVFIPLIGGIVLLIENGFKDGTQGPNRFGPSPKGIGGEANLAQVFV
jgi:uncharacterized membrane protein YhaH (DUF805 family)